MVINCTEYVFLSLWSFVENGMYKLCDRPPPPCFFFGMMATFRNISFIHQEDLDNSIILTTLDNIIVTYFVVYQAELLSCKRNYSDWVIVV